MTEKSRTIAVRFVSDPEERAAVSAAVLADLPDWFGIPESTAQYVSDSRGQPSGPPRQTASPSVFWR